MFLSVSLKDWNINERLRSLSGKYSINQTLNLFRSYAYYIIMSRPKKFRCVSCKPGVGFFGPSGIRLFRLDETILGLDELEAMRLADLEGLYQEEAASRMNVSRATFGRVINEAHRKVADAIIHGKALTIESENVEEN
jgi:predicted DNA-binding protein (UPF0251 family)